MLSSSFFCLMNHTRNEGDRGYLCWRLLKVKLINMIFKYLKKICGIELVVIILSTAWLLPLKSFWKDCWEDQGIFIIPETFLKYCTISQIRACLSGAVNPRKDIVSGWECYTFHRRGKAYFFIYIWEQKHTEDMWQCGH